MPIVRKASEKDESSIRRILAELGLIRPGLCTEKFRVACDDGHVVAVLHIEEFNGGLYMSAVGVSKSMQGRGIAGQLLTSVLSQLRGDVYLHTTIPGFFKKFGFEAAESPIRIPAVEELDCGACDGAAVCICMMRPSDAP